MPGNEGRNHSTMTLLVLDTVGSGLPMDDEQGTQALKGRTPALISVPAVSASKVGRMLLSVSLHYRRDIHMRYPCDVLSTLVGISPLPIAQRIYGPL
jgi:hypothetical protein